MQLRVTRPGFLEGIQKVKAAQGIHELRRQSRRDAPGDARVRLRPVPRRVLLQRTGEAADVSVGQRAEGRRDPRVLRGERLQGLDARRDRRADAEGAASGVRDVEPGHPRAVGRRVRRLPHAVSARRRDEDQRPPRAQPAAEHQPRVPDVPPLVRGRAAGSRVETIQDRTFEVRNMAMDALMALIADIKAAQATRRRLTRRCETARRHQRRGAVPARLHRGGELDGISRRSGSRARARPVARRNAPRPGVAARQRRHGWAQTSNAAAAARQK